MISLSVYRLLLQIVVMQNKAPVFMQKVTYEPQSAAIHPGLTEVAIGGGAVSFYFYSLHGIKIHVSKSSVFSLFTSEYI